MPTKKNTSNSDRRTSYPLFTMYTTSWCGDCFRLKQWLSANRYQTGHDFVEINIEHHPDAVAKVEEINHGYRSVPTLVFSDGSTMTEPSTQQVADKLGQSLKVN